MRLRTKFILFVSIFHVVLLGSSYFLLRQNKVLFIISEVFIIISILLSWQLYRQLIQPLQLLMRQAAAIKDRDFNVKLLLTGKYEMDELILIYNQMIDKLRNERVTQEQQHMFLKKLILTSPTGIIILDYDENIHEINPKACRLLGIEEKEVLGKSIDAVTQPVLEQIGQLQSGEARTITFNGINTFKLQKSHFIDRGFARHFVMIEELTAEILLAEKKAYGKVIRMMAHEVNNTIGPVNSILQSILSSGKLWEKEETHLLRQALQVALDRNHNLNLFMRNFTEVVRLPEPRKKTMDLHQLISSVSNFLEMMAKEKDIRFNYYLDDSPFLIIADELQMEQAIINVVKNSIEAIEEEGIISFTTDTGSRQLIITDNGTGISQQHANQLFSPFFSTKKEGQGIGLTLVKEILLNHSYEFSLRTISANETKFILRFT